MSEFKTDLGDYILWYDGMVQVDPSRMEGLFLSGIDPKQIAVTEVDSAVQKYNRLTKDKITIKDEVVAENIKFDYLIPPEYLAIDVKKYIHDLAKRKVFSDNYEIRMDRIERELQEYTDRNLLDILRVLIYTVDMFKKNNVVWGVGRGSSCASYLLYLLEVHCVDPIKYDIPLEEFFK